MNDRNEAMTMENMETKRIDDNIQLTEHFNLLEFVRSGTAITLGIDNHPPRLAVECLTHLCQTVLEPLRRRFGKIRITSGYRCDTLNAAVGGARRSQHRLGQAADIFVPSEEEGQKMFNYIRGNLPFDQLIFEHSESRKTRWIHVSIRPDMAKNRRKAWTALCR